MPFELVEQPQIPEDIFECAIHLRNNLFLLTTEGGSELEYELARQKLMDHPVAKRLLPNFVRYSNDAKSVRLALFNVATGPGSWTARRKHVDEAFVPLLSHLEKNDSAADHTITKGLKVYGATAVQVTCHGVFPPLSIRVRPNLSPDNEANEIYGRTDHRHFDRAW